MSSGIYAVAHVGDKKIFVGEASRLSILWLPILAQLNSGNHPNLELQKAWNKEGGKRRFSFHLKQDIIRDREIIGSQRLRIAESQKKQE
ncbi:hypothetical protein [Lusitaniella coriacea]|uniref:hypothetical protein n=1 Tax=Lusitaniella coriacea TaxID=1983105 RepID=UPI003CF5AE14